MPDLREKMVEILDESFERQYDKNLVITARNTANDLIANGVTIQRWIPVDEMTPEPYERVIVRDFYGVIAVGHIFGEQWVVSWTNDCLPFVTHWMPLPDAPKGE